MKFERGQIVVTRGVNDLMADSVDFAKFVTESFRRYIAGDWGEMYEKDKHLNDVAIKFGDRIFAAYKNNNYKIYIITEWDRSVTTILFPDEY